MADLLIRKSTMFLSKVAKSIMLSQMVIKHVILIIRDAFMEWVRGLELFVALLKSDLFRWFKALFFKLRRKLTQVSYKA